MTTIIDPTGTPVPVYNKSGTTVSEVTIDMSVAVIVDMPAPSTNTILIATVVPGSLTGDRGIRFSADANVGDVVEIYCDNTQYILHAPAGEEIVVETPASGDPFRSFAGANRFTKISPTKWARR